MMCRYMRDHTPKTGGAIADHTWEVKPSEFENIANTILGALNGPATTTITWIAPLIRDLQQHKGASIVLAGDNQPPIIHALAHAMNSALGNVGKTVFYTDPLEVKSVDHRESLTELVNDIDAGKVDVLVIIGGNPVYNTPTDLKFTLKRLEKVKLRAHLSQYKDETSQLCHWHVPAAHYLEAWGDTRSYDGTATIMQPLIEPLYEGKTPYELLAVFSDQYDRKPYEIVRSYWQKQRAGGGNQAQGQTAGAQNRTAQQSPSPAATPAAAPSPS